MIVVERKGEEEVGEYKMATKSQVAFKSEKDKDVVVFKGVHNTIINSFRRIILDDVPTFAIEDVEVVANDSPLYSEAIAHRLGLIPLKTDFKSYNIKSKCTCGGVGCALCEVKMTLSCDEEGYVMSSLIKSDDPQIVPVYENIPITKLFDGKVEFNMKAILGTGREHAKWAPGHAYLNDNGDEVELIIESFGQMSGKDIYNKAIDVLIDKIDELEGKL